MAMNYNPETGQYEQDDDFFADTEPPAPPAQTQDDINDVMRNPNQQPPYSPGEGNSWYWNAEAGRWSVRTGSTSGNRPGYQDLEYWKSQGVNESDIFDTATGQIKPGWRRTGNGYERVVVDKPPADPPPDDGPDDGPDDDPGGFSGLTPPPRLALSNLNETYPQFVAPQFQAPEPFSYEPFSYDPFSYESFQAPTLSEAQAEPGFEFALNQGIKAFENSKAYLGTYKTGATITGLNDYARNMANTNYNDVFQRKGETYDRNRGNAFNNWQGNRENAFGNWSANRENAADAYATNYGISRDVFDRKYQGAKDEYQPKARAAELQFGRDWDQYAYEGDDAYRRWKALVDANAT